MRDEWFIRGEIPMTKSEVRAVSLSKLELNKDSVLLDIGAGTGSVSIEAILCHPVKTVYAFEKKDEAVELLKKNRGKAEISDRKLVITEGIAPEVFPEVFSEQPTHAFIGGSSGNMERLITRLLEINREMRIVVNVIALETLVQVVQLLKEREIEGEIVSVQVARAKQAGDYHLMQGQNPVYVITFGGKYEETDSPAAVCGA
ncbi:MAG: precorrin-6Y C5,15-methyltransferase (decarboxylating) subunit CbiT [Clostridium sp.]